MALRKDGCLAGISTNMKVQCFDDGGMAGLEQDMIQVIGYGVFCSTTQIQSCVSSNTQGPSFVSYSKKGQSFGDGHDSSNKRVWLGFQDCSLGFGTPCPCLISPF